MRPRPESPGPLAQVEDDGTEKASAWTPSRRQRRTPWMAVWNRDAGTDGEAQGHAIEASSAGTHKTVSGGP